MCDLHLQIPSNIVDIIRKVTHAYELFIMVVGFFSSTKIDWGHNLLNNIRKSDVVKLPWPRNLWLKKWLETVGVVQGNFVERVTNQNSQA